MVSLSEQPGPLQTDAARSVYSSFHIAHTFSVEYAQTEQKRDLKQISTIHNLCHLLFNQWDDVGIAEPKEYEYVLQECFVHHTAEHKQNVQ